MDKIEIDLNNGLRTWNCNGKEVQIPDGQAAAKEMINHPSHYNREGSMECLDEMILIYGEEATAWFCLLNAHKYRYRAGQKDHESAMKDLKKSDWYMQKFAELRKQVLEHEVED